METAPPRFEDRHSPELSYLQLNVGQSVPKAFQKGSARNYEVDKNPEMHVSKAFQDLAIHPTGLIVPLLLESHKQKQFVESSGKVDP